jgi:hypothetical protein
MSTKLWSENLKGRDHSEDLGVDGKIILKGISGKLGGKLWTGCHLVQVRDQWQAVVNRLIGIFD